MSDKPTQTDFRCEWDNYLLYLVKMQDGKRKLLCPMCFPEHFETELLETLGIHQVESKEKG